MRFLLLSIEFDAGEACWPIACGADAGGRGHLSYGSTAVAAVQPLTLGACAWLLAGTFSGNGVYACSQVRQAGVACLPVWSLGAYALLSAVCLHTAG